MVAVALYSIVNASACQASELEAQPPTVSKPSSVLSHPNAPSPENNTKVQATDTEKIKKPFFDPDPFWDKPTDRDYNTHRGTNSSTTVAAKHSGLQEKSKKGASIDSVKRSYNEGKFKDSLDQIATMKPTSETHYWAGLCYQGQGQLAAAANEFQWVARYAKDPQLRYHAQHALNDVSAYSKGRKYEGQGNNFDRVRRRGRRR
jgi:hypothetical protein